LVSVADIAVTGVFEADTQGADLERVYAYRVACIAPKYNFQMTSARYPDLPSIGWHFFYCAFFL